MFPLGDQKSPRTVFYGQLRYFQKFIAEIKRFWPKNGWFYMILVIFREKKRKISPQNAKTGLDGPVKQGCFFFFLVKL